jgi:hypothetical protein
MKLQTSWEKWCDCDVQVDPGGCRVSTRPQRLWMWGLQPMTKPKIWTQFLHPINKPWVTRGGACNPALAAGSEAHINSSSSIKQRMQPKFKPSSCNSSNLQWASERTPGVQSLRALAVRCQQLRWGTIRELRGRETSTVGSRYQAKAVKMWLWTLVCVIVNCKL